MNKLLRTTFVALLAGAVTFSLPSAANAQEIKARFGHGLSDDHPQGKAAKMFAATVDKNSKGRIKISVIANQALGPDPQMLSALQGGVQEFYAGSSLALIGQVKEIGFQDVPFLFNKETEAHAVYDGPVGKVLNDKLAEKGVIVLGWWENGFRHITNSKHPVNKVSDLQDLKFRTQPNPLTLDAFKALGANASPLPWSELFVALESKAFDGQENPIVLMYTQRFYEVQKYLTLSSHVYSPLMFAVSKKFWDGLSADDKQMLSTAAKEATAFQRKETASEADKALQGMKDKGMQVAEFSAAEKQIIRDKVGPAIEKHLEKIGPDFMALVRREIQATRTGK
jgi:tripartite ATP-independent transporter DctP family solute receptor